MSLRDRLFADGAALFDRLAVSFVGATAYTPVSVAWSVDASSASTRVVWVAPESVQLRGVNLVDGADVVEFVPFTDADGAAGTISLLSGYEFDFALTVAVLGAI